MEAADNRLSLYPTPSKKSQLLKYAVLGGVLVVGVWLFMTQQSKQSVATVNGSTISRAELNKKLVERFGEQTLEALIGERLIVDEASKQKVVASNEELQSKIAEVEKSLQGSMSLDESLALQGISRVEFENQMKMQLLIEKMLASQVAVTASEVADYVKNNKSTLTSSTAAEQLTEAETELKNTKMAQVFSEWFASLKEKATVTRNL